MGLGFVTSFMEPFFAFLTDGHAVPHVTRVPREVKVTVDRACLRFHWLWLGSSLLVESEQLLFSLTDMCTTSVEMCLG